MGIWSDAVHLAPGPAHVCSCRMASPSPARPPARLFDRLRACASACARACVHACACLRACACVPVSACLCLHACACVHTCSDAETGVLELLDAAQLLGAPDLYSGGTFTRSHLMPIQPRGANTKSAGEVRRQRQRLQQQGCRGAS